MKVISLSNGTPVLVDDEDFDALSKYRWYSSKSGGGCPKVYPAAYVLKEGKKKWVKMHRFLFGEKPPQFVDHRDGNTLNNCRSNLRPCTKYQNQCNQKLQVWKNKSSRFKGVSWSKLSNLWDCRIKNKGKVVFIGRFESEIDAAKAYDSAALKFHGEFAKTNKMLGLL